MPYSCVEINHREHGEHFDKLSRTKKIVTFVYFVVKKHPTQRFFHLGKRRRKMERARFVEEIPQLLKV